MRQFYTTTLRFTLDLLSGWWVCGGSKVTSLLRVVLLHVRLGSVVGLVAIRWLLAVRLLVTGVIGGGCVDCSRGHFAWFSAEPSAYDRRRETF